MLKVTRHFAVCHLYCSHLLKASSSPCHTKSSYIKTELEICKGLSIDQDMTVPIKKGLFQLRRTQRLKKRIHQTVPPQKLTSRILRGSHPLVPIATLRLKLTQMFLKEITMQFLHSKGKSMRYDHLKTFT